jgi:uncharacterized protein (DUF2345 family)
MHWNNGKFHENITVGQTVYVTDHKHIAIHGTKDYTTFGEYETKSNIYGKSIAITANDEVSIQSNNKSISNTAKTNMSFTAGGYVDTKAGTYMNISANDAIVIQSNNKSIYNTAKTSISNIAGNYVDTKAGTYININANDEVLIQSNNKSISNTAKTSMSFTAGQGISISAGKSISVLSSEDMNINVRYLNINTSSGITVNNKNYGTSLPTSGNVEGRLFFKLIS